MAVKMKNAYKVYASVISFDIKRSEFVEVGDKLLVPLTYPGWFQLVRQAGADVRRLRTIADVKNARITEFVASGRITAFRSANGSGADDELYAVVVPSGEVLTTKSVLTEWLSEDNVDRGCFCLRRRKEKPDSCHLKVRNASGVQLLLPYETEGHFFEVGSRSDVSGTEMVYQLADIVRWLRLPVNLRLVCGDIPEVIAAHCTGLFRLTRLAIGRVDPECTAGKIVAFPAGPQGASAAPNCISWVTPTQTRRPSAAATPDDGHRGDEPRVDVTRKAPHITSPDDGVRGPVHLRASSAKDALVRSLPPTPLLPRNIKQKKVNGWCWARNLLTTRWRKAARRSDADASECSDYEVIPFYLRAVDSLMEEASSGGKEDDAPEMNDLAVTNPGCERDGPSTEAGSERGPTTPPPPPPPHVKVKVSARRHLDGRHDEDGYLLPLEVRPLRKRGAVTSCRPGEDNGRSVASLDAASSATLIARDPDVGLPVRTSPTSSTTDGSMDRSTETLLAPPSSCTMPSNVRSAGESAYSPASYDRDRLDRFLADSIDELRRRRSRELLTNITELSGSRAGRARRALPAGGDRLDSIDSREEVDAFLEKIFDCDSMSDAAPTRRSMSVPESMLQRLDAAQRGSRRQPDCGYQTIDSGIWLSPRSAASDPCRQERDTATYRSTSDCSWAPPDSVGQLTVEEVGLSLRYIGMKDAVVTRFCEEQIDGKQLAELTYELVTEGFPELNALEKKKLCDFINGWRPKKWGYTPVE